MACPIPSTWGSRICFSQASGGARGGQGFSEFESVFSQLPSQETWFGAPSALFPKGKSCIGAEGAPNHVCWWKRCLAGSLLDESSLPQNNGSQRSKQAEPAGTSHVCWKPKKLSDFSDPSDERSGIRRNGPPKMGPGPQWINGPTCLALQFAKRFLFFSRGV